MDCEKAIKKGICKNADCCGIVPIPAHTFEKHKHKLKKNLKWECLFDDVVVYNKDTNRCGFLDHNYKCMIYKDRPQVCRDYGKSDELHCPYLNTNGKLMSPAKRKRWQRIINRQVNDTMDILDKRLK